MGMGSGRRGQFRFPKFKWKRVHVVRRYHVLPMQITPDEILFWSLSNLVSGIRLDRAATGENTLVVPGSTIDPDVRSMSLWR